MLLLPEGHGCRLVLFGRAGMEPKATTAVVQASRHRRGQAHDKIKDIHVAMPDSLHNHAVDGLGQHTVPPTMNRRQVPA